MPSPTPKQGLGLAASAVKVEEATGAGPYQVTPSRRIPRYRVIEKQKGRELWTMLPSE